MPWWVRIREEHLNYGGLSTLLPSELLVRYVARWKPHDHSIHTDRELNQLSD